MDPWAPSSRPDKWPSSPTSSRCRRDSGAFTPSSRRWPSLRADDVVVRGLARLLDQIKAESGALSLTGLADTAGLMSTMTRRGGGLQMKVRGLRELFGSLKINYEAAMRSATTPEAHRRYARGVSRADRRDTSRGGAMYLASRISLGRRAGDVPVSRNGQMAAAPPPLYRPFVKVYDSHARSTRPVCPSRVRVRTHAPGRTASGPGCPADLAATCDVGERRRRRREGHRPEPLGRLLRPSDGTTSAAAPLRRARSRSMSGPLTMTIMALMSTPTSVDTNVSALRMSVAPIEANRTPIQYPHRRVSGAEVRPGRRLSRSAGLRNPFHFNDEERHAPTYPRAPMASGLLLLPALLFAAGAGTARRQDTTHHHDHADPTTRSRAGAASRPAGRSAPTATPRPPTSRWSRWVTGST